MSYQRLQGVKITPKGAQNRFANKAWGVSEAFGGWIFSADCSIGFSDKPTELSMKIILESPSDLSALTPATFDILKEDLKCSAGIGGRNNESLFDIDFNGVKYTDFILFSYDIDIQPNQKTLSVVFKDYSILLDKIYVGLIKRQGSEHIRLSSAAGLIPMVCPDCTFGSFTGDGELIRDIEYGSYVGINGKTYDNFAGAPWTDVAGVWDYLYERSVMSPVFDLNGGYVILGTEEMYSDVCSTVPEVKYTFKNLMESLRVRGINLLGAFSNDFVRENPYSQNYFGTLREVLNNWSSDFGLQFFTSGRSFIGIDLKQEIDISQILEIADPKSSLGATFDGNTNGVALSSYRESHSLENTYKQAVITADVRPREVKSESREVKNLVGFQPLHPLDFYSPNWTELNFSGRQNIASNAYRSLNSVVFANNFERTSKRMSTFTNRLFRDIDVSIALSKYDKDLRDIYCADRAIHSNIRFSNSNGRVILSDIPDHGGTSNSLVYDFYANFEALGFNPKMQILNPSSKEAVLRQLKATEGQNISLHPDFYEIFVGYYFESVKGEVTSYESNWAGSMYKYGVMNIGTTSIPPYVIRDRNELLEPSGGLFGNNGASLMRITNSFNPGASLYPIYQNAPYYNLMPYAALGDNPNAYDASSLNNIGFNSNDYYIASLTNEWGTSESEFSESLYGPLSPICDKMFGGSQSLQELQASLPMAEQHFNIKDFAPSIHAINRDLYSNLKTELDNLSDNALDEIGIFSVGADNKIHQECAKLHICIVPNVRTHPNVRISIELNGYRSDYNEVMARTLKLQFEENRINLLKEKPKNACDYSALTQMCNDEIINRNEISPLDIRYGCNNVDDSNAVLYAGWPSGYAYNNNTRSLSVSIERNPVTDMAARGGDGAYYYSELSAVSQPELLHRFSSARIVYPVCNEPGIVQDEYIGVLSTNIAREIRTPPFLEIYGNPVNSTENNTIMAKVINNTIDPDIKPELDPNTRRFVKYTTVYSGDGSSGVLHSVSDYHNFIKGLNNYQSNYPTKTANFTVIGSPNLFGDFSRSMSPLNGLNNFNITIGDNGVETALSFSNRPPVLAKQEAILNKIGPRLKPK